MAWAYRPLRALNLPLKEVKQGKTQGAFDWVTAPDGAIVGMLHTCPARGCGGFFAMRFPHYGGSKKTMDALGYERAPKASWNGSLDRPSFQEFINTACGWEGYFKDGFWCYSPLKD